MNITTADEFKRIMPEYRWAAWNGSIFAYPTDTIYGVWAVVSPETVGKIDAIKNREPWKFYSIIAPSFSRIKKYFKVDKKHLEEQWSDWTDKYGGITVLLPLKLGYDFNLVSSTDIVGVRIVNNWFQEFVELIGQPFITTSLNISGQSPIQKVQEIPEHLHDQIDIAIDDGIIEWTPSTIINYETWEVNVRK